MSMQEEKLCPDVKKLNSFLKSASKAYLESAMSGILLSERQENVFNLYFIKKKDVNFIADALCVSPRVIGREIYSIRSRILSYLSL